MIFTAAKYRLVKLYALVFAAIIFLGALGIFFFPIIMLYRSNIFYLLFSTGACVVLALLVYLFLTRKYRRRKKIIKTPFPQEWERILDSNVAFYGGLTDEDRTRFKQEVQIFLAEKRITGIETDVDDKCRLLVAASAIIPIFSFPDWEYAELGEILIYPYNFDENYDFGSLSSGILGLVTRGGSTMILSKPALFHDFSSSSANTNVGFHEFAHKIDGEDGFIDGVPPMITDRKQLKQWLEIIEVESDRIRRGESEIDPYALSNRAEFFAVTSEYFFENPHSLEQKHPALFQFFQKIYNRDTVSKVGLVVKFMFKPYGKKIHPHSACPCGSGKRYKDCCLGKESGSCGDIPTAAM